MKKKKNLYHDTVIHPVIGRSFIFQFYCFFFANKILIGPRFDYDLYHGK